MKSDSIKFDDTWWDNFLETTHNMAQTSVFKDCLTRDETTLLRKYILQILAELARLRTFEYGYRVYIEGTQLAKHEMLNIFDSPPTENENLEDWVQRVFGEKKFGMIINQGERFNLELSKLIALKLKPLLEKTGIPTEGIIFTLFIGNYDSTPLGIHLDLPGKSVLHFHLGPGSKTMYTWDTKEYEELVGEIKTNNKPSDRILQCANKHAFDEGDIYFMPENIYHIGMQEGLSIAIACWCYNRANKDFALTLQRLVADEYLQSSNLMLKPDRSQLEDTSEVEKTLELINFPDGYDALSYKDVMRNIYKDLRYSLHSNAGYKTSPFPKNQQAGIELEDIIEIEDPYKILYAPVDSNNQIALFVRGKKTIMNNLVGIKQLVDILNNGEKIKVIDLLNNLNNDWDPAIGLYLLELIFKYHGLKIVNKAA